MLSICKSVGSSLLSLLAALKDLSNAGGVLSIPKNILLCLLHQTYLFKILVRKIRLLVLLQDYRLLKEFACLIDGYLSPL